MLKNLLVGLLSFSFIFNQNTINEYSNIKKYFSRTNEIVIVCDNNYIICDNNNCEKIKNSINDICINSYEMPALGVSIHEQTIEYMKKGLWLIFKYNNTQYHNGMPFDELLIEVNPDYYGFNIIRKYKGRYDGRCYYINLNNDMGKLFDALRSIYATYKKC